MKNISAAFELHNTLNPKIWGTDNKLLPDVKVKLDEIVDEFADSIDVPLTIIDAHIVGSNASYNYTEHSDLDLHCIVNFARIDADPIITEAWMWAQKKLFNDEYDITINGINVEIYVEDIGSNTTSNGIYSLFEDDWIKFPEPIDAEVDQEAIDAWVDDLKVDLRYVLKSDNIRDIQDTIDELYLIRKNGLATDGEYGVGNQVFKEIRNLGYLDQLNDKIARLKSEQLSIPAN